MSNPLISMMAKQAVGNMPQAQMMQRFAEFRRAMAGRDPQQMIDEMLRTGRINAQHLEQAKAMAAQMRSMFK